MSYIAPNQKTITTNKSSTVINGHYFTYMDKECMFEAMRNLKPNEFKMYIYLSMNKDQYTQALSTSYASEMVGANKRNIQDAINGLIEKGYLVQIGTSNEYNFYENLDEKHLKNINLHEKLDKPDCDDDYRGFMRVI